jgi:hypothetical protein
VNKNTIAPVYEVRLRPSPKRNAAQQSSHTSPRRASVMIYASSWAAYSVYRRHEAYHSAG